jgi:hypothetical protein
MNRYTLMTYDQWQHRFKTTLKRTIKRKLIQTLQLLILAIIISMPIWMLMDWILFGY